MMMRSSPCAVRTQVAAEDIFRILEEALAAPDATDPQQLAIQDRARESFVVCLGGLASHLPVEGGKPAEIMDKLLTALRWGNLPPFHSLTHAPRPFRPHTPFLLSSFPPFHLFPSSSSTAPV